MTYVFETIFWYFMPAFLYQKLVFRSIPGMSYAHSNLVFWGLQLVLAAIGFLITYRQHRNTLTVWINSAFPTMIYFCISFGREYAWQIRLVGGIIGLVIALYTILVAFNLRRDAGAGRHFPWIKILNGLLHGYRVLIGAIAGLTLCVFILGIAFGVMGFQPNTSASDPAGHTETIADNIETLCLLRQDSWEDMSVQERLDVLQVVANIEASYLGLPHELNVFASAMSSDTAGYYYDPTHSIHINLDLISYTAPHEILHTLTHEAYHAYEHRLAELYLAADASHQNLLLFRNVKEYPDEFSNYNDGDEDIWGYATQQVEIDADDYADSAVMDYYTSINDHLNSVG